MPISVTVCALRVDIITLGCDAIVSAMSSSLFSGGDVDGVIHRVAGSELLKACHVLHGCHTDETKPTPDLRPPVRYVAHIIGLIRHGNWQDEATLLAACYHSSPELAHKHEVRSTAFPRISTGVHGFPPQLTTPTVAHAVREHGAGLDAITFYCFSAVHLALHEAALVGDK